ncbi:hypothetical protein ABZZ36_30275 [Actinacidiphila glaucinigra]|uniref:hypothetical protein n=1 Tax=Actinacidiphila glaucinigra TaxID=235986 RepID=UPI0033B7AC72
MTPGRVALSGGGSWINRLRSRTIGREVHNPGQLAVAIGGLNTTMAELKRAVRDYDQVGAADLYALAWHKAADIPVSASREQRRALREIRETIDSQAWKQRSREEAAKSQQPGSAVAPPPQPKTTRRAKPQRSARPESATRPPIRQSASDQGRALEPRQSRSGASSQPASEEREVVVELMPLGELLEIASQVRPVLTRIARDGALVTWSGLRQRIHDLPRLSLEDQAAVLVLVDEDCDGGEPLLSALVTVGNGQMHPHFPVIVEFLGRGDAKQARTVWSYEVLKVRQWWRHR